MIEWSEHHRAAGRTIAFVPTMGYLHEGHLALMREAKKLGDRLVVSIFVNPTQFGPAEDFNAYPRDLVRDLAMAESVGVDMVFTPSATDMYPEGADTKVCQKRLPAHLCGLSRPGHFTGVLTVVAKLFHIIHPHFAVFGQKDWQQLAVIKKMVKDLNFGIHIVGLPTVREHDGLAMSSRNARLDPPHREAALSLYRVLAHAQQQVQGGQHKASAIIRSAENKILQYPENRIDYIRICHPDTLDDITDIRGPTLMALAVFVGGVRLIDNMMLQPSNGPPGHRVVRGTAS
jgi:pantoate--beta-alanine ligase